MAKPLLNCPKHWIRGTLEPNSKLGLITHVDTGGTPSTTDEDNWDGEIAWLTPKEITGMVDGVYVSRTERFITQKGLDNSSAKLLPIGTVMLTKRAPVGAVAINAIPMATNQGFLNFRCGKRLNPLYLTYWLRTNKPYLDMVANGSTYPELYKSDLFELEISIPSIEEQDTILRVISALQYVTLLGLALEQSMITPEAMIKVQEQNRRLRTIRDAILPKLLSGDLDISNVKNTFSEVFNDTIFGTDTIMWQRAMPSSLWT